MIKCIVIDDEPFARETIVEHIAEIDELELLGEFENAIDAMPIIGTGTVDLVFCDIQMPDVSGVTLLKILKNIQTPPLFVYVTGDPNYAVESYELDVLDYILKPFGKDRLIKTVIKAQALLASTNSEEPHRDFLIIKDRSENVIMPYDDIFFIKSDREYVTIVTQERNLCVYKRLAEMERKLAPVKQFLRVQKSYIVNLDYARTVVGNEIKMKGNIKNIPIGEQYRAELYRRLGIQK